jgi:hypothetical protein
MGPFMVEIVFCRVTRRGRKKGKGLNKAAMEASKNNMSGPQSFIPKDDVIKVTLDLSDNGPVFSAMDEMMMKMMEDEENERKKGGGKGKGGGGAAAKDSLKRLMKSGIPGVEKLFTGPGQAPGPGGKKQSKGFHKMNDSSKQKFMTAVFGEDGTTIDSGTAAALLAATCSGGDPTIANNIAQLLMPEIGAEIDQAMMGALMAACSLINAGANTEEVMKAMKAELRNSGMSEEEILLKTCLLMKCFNREDPGASMAEYNLASKQKNLALKNNGTSPKDFTLVVMVMKAIAACGSTPENVAKVIMIENQLSKKGAQSRFISDALKHLADYEKDREKVISALQAAFSEDKLNRDDVFLSVRMAQAIENENEPTWKDVKNMKELIAGCSVSSPEGIELNLARATKTGGLKSHDMTAALVAQKLMAHMQVDPKCLAQIINIMKNVSENGVPAVEIARVFNDGIMPPEMVEYLATQALEAVAQDITPVDVDAHVQLYDNLRLKSNIPLEVIEFVENKLVQVRCSLEDVADNMVSSQLARGEKESMVIRALCETLSKTGSSSEIVATTMMSALKRVLSETKSDCDIMKAIGNTMHEQGTEKENLQKAMVELLLNTLNEDPDSYDLRMEALKTIEQVLKDAGSFGAEVKEFMDTQVVHLLPPEPPDPKEQEEIRRKQEEEDAAAAAAAAAEEKAAEEAAAKESALVNGNGPLKNPNLDKLNGGSRAGSRRGSADVILGGSRRGSYYGDDITSKATVAMVVDDPESKDKINALLGDEEQDNGPDLEATFKAMRSGKVTDEQVRSLMSVFETSGIVSSTGGVVRLRKVSDLRSSLEGVNSAFDRAIEDAHNKESPQISSENRRLMEDILKRSQDNQDQMSSRVTALLAGSSLTTTAGVRIDRRDTIDQIDYTAVGDDLSKLKESYKPRRRKAQSEMRAPTSLHQANSAELEDRCADAGIRVQRRSIKRMSLARLRKSSEFSGLRHPGANGGLPEDPEANGIAEIPEEDHRRIKGLRKAKVSMMVYSHGGFSRCFRIARRYQVEGPAIGVEYEEDTTNTVPKPAAAVENV